MENYVFISKQSSLADETFGLEKLQELHEVEEIPMDFETTGLDVFTLTPILLGIHGNGVSYVINLLTYSQKEIHDALLPLVDKLWIAHNMKYDLKILMHHYDIKPKRVWCTQLASQVLYNGTDLKHSLDALVERHFDEYLDKTQRNSFIDRDLSIPISLSEIEYLTGDLKYLSLLHKRQLLIAEKLKVQTCLDLEMEFCPVICKLELNGVTLDTAQWKKNIAKYEDELIVIEKELRKLLLDLNKKFGFLKEPKVKNAPPKEQMAMFDMGAQVSISAVLNNFNFGSAAQIKEVLKKCKVDLEDTGEGKLSRFTTDNPNNPVVPFIKKLLEFREKTKLISTYGEKFLSNVNPVTGRVHSNYSQCFTDTGRLSSSSPKIWAFIL